MRATVWGAAALLAALAITGCADDTGAVDDLGHNGFDKMTCEDFKILAMDAQYAAVTPAQGRVRAHDLVKQSAHAADPVVRNGVQAYVNGYLAGDRTRTAAAVTALMRVCRF